MTSKFLRAVALTSISIALLAGCQATTKEINPLSTVHYDANYDFSDKRRIVDHFVASLTATRAGDTAKPMIVVYDVANETSEHINTRGITDDIRLKLIQANRFRFINRVAREKLNEEVAYQNGGAVLPAQRISMGKQLGAQMMLAGSLRSIEKEEPSQWRLNKRELVYYSMNLELTDLETSEILWADQVEIAREASKPIVSW